jgi:hypothetical protein
MRDPYLEYLDRHGVGRPLEYLGQGQDIGRPRGAAARAAGRRGEDGDVELRQRRLRLLELAAADLRG